MGKIFPLSDTQVIGRLASCTIPIKDTRASREHARIYRGELGYCVVDLNSKNGIAVNGERLERAVLKPGDQIQVGDTWCRVDFNDDDLKKSEKKASKPLSADPDDRAALTGQDVELRRKEGPTSVSEVPLRTTAQRTRRTMANAGMTRTSLAWLRTDLAQVSSLYRFLVILGILAVAAGLAYLGFWLTS